MYTRDEEGGQRTSIALKPRTPPHLAYASTYLPGRMMRGLVLSILALLCVLSDGVDARIHLKVNRDSRRVVYLGVFDFGPRGNVSLSIKSLSLPTSLLESSGEVVLPNVRMGFVVVPVDSVQEARNAARFSRGEVGGSGGKSLIPMDNSNAEDIEDDNGDDASPEKPTNEPGKIEKRRVKKPIERYCFVEDPLVTHSKQRPDARLVHFSFRGQKIEELRQQWRWNKEVESTGLFAVYFYNCAGYKKKKGDQLTDVMNLPPLPVSYDVDFVVTWRDQGGGDSALIYLSYSELPLLTMYLIFSILFLCMTGAWAYLIAIHFKQVKMIHGLMLVLLVVKMFTLFLEYFRLRHYRQTGRDALVLDSFYYAALTLKGIMLFGVILLLGSGWSILRGYLSQRDKKVLFIVLPLQVAINVCLMMMEATGEGSKNWVTWVELLRVIDAICCCCVLLPVFWSIKTLSDSAHSSSTENHSRDIARLRQFRSLYIVIIAYIYTTRILLVMWKNSLSYQHEWFAACGAELVAALLYAHCGYRFPPGAKDPYSAVSALDVIEFDDRSEV